MTQHGIKKKYRRLELRYAMPTPHHLPSTSALHPFPCLVPAFRHRMAHAGAAGACQSAVGHAPCRHASLLQQRECFRLTHPAAEMPM